MAEGIAQSLFIELCKTLSTTTPLQGDWALATTTYNRIPAELTVEPSWELFARGAR
ncbi:hypothetical protein ACH41E_29635 [Streptomyces sp. NPDC020412]|uniref:hypothetical protein n=1 Tax=Streptomyces sp. NPDC020412 TaxID=3365073 RepID=UPI0037B0C734